jgi:hypothetical protein
MIFSPHSLHPPTPRNAQISIKRTTEVMSCSFYHSSSLDSIFLLTALWASRRLTLFSKWKPAHGCIAWSALHDPVSGAQSGGDSKWCMRVSCNCAGDGSAVMSHFINQRTRDNRCRTVSAYVHVLPAFPAWAPFARKTMHPAAWKHPRGRLLAEDLQHCFLLLLLHSKTE